MCNLKSRCQGCVEGAWCVFGSFSWWNHIWSVVSFGVLGSQGLLYCLLWRWCRLIASLQGIKKFRNWAQVGGSYSDTKALPTLSSLFREERTTVNVPSLVACCTWCLNHCWNTPFSFCCIGTGAKWTYFMERLTVSLSTCNMTALKSCVSLILYAWARIFDCRSWRCSNKCNRPKIPMKNNCTFVFSVSL